MTLFQSLAHRSFALLWSGQTISRLGDSVFQIALAWWVLEKTGSAAAMGTVLIFTSVPLLLFTLLGGVAVDRFPRARLMVLSDSLRGLAVLVIAVLAFGQWLELWHVFLISFFFGLVDAVFQSAYAAIVPELIPAEIRASANSLTSISRELSGVLGPALGAAVVALGGTPLAFLVDALSFFVSATCLFPLAQCAVAPVCGPGASNVLTSLKEGFGTALGSTWLWLTLLLSAFSGITLGGPMNAALPLLVKEHLHADVTTLGLVLTLTAVGSVLGALWLGRVGHLRHRGIAMYVGSIIGALTSVVFGLPVPLGAVYAAAVVRGLCFCVDDLIWINALQELVPRERLGRVSSIDVLAMWAFAPIGFALGGWAADQFGAPSVFVVGGLVTASLALLGLVQPAIRNLD
jgi:MFS family permease